MAYKNPEDQHTYYKKWCEKNREHVRSEGRKRQAKHRATPYGKKRNSRVKDAVFGAYGGYICACCGELEKGFLTLDHINNDGGEQRKKGLRGHTLHEWIIANDFPPNYQVLCFNCNCGRAANNGICPHKADKPSPESVPQGN